MAAYCKRKCSVCGEQHTFCLPTASMLSANVTYEYDCPTKKRRGTFELPDLKFEPADRGIPQNSVIIKEVES